MVRSKRLTSVVKLMNHRQQEAARRLENYAQQLQQQRKRLQELEVYKEEYLHGYNNYIKAGMTMSRINDYHKFIGHLEQAISQQRLKVCNANKEYESCRQEWLSRRCSVKAVDKMVGRYQAEERQLEGRQEQHESDESSRHFGDRPWDRDNGN